MPRYSGSGSASSNSRVERPHEVCLVFAAEDGTERCLTWQELNDRSNQIARGLQERGLEAGRRLALSLRNSPELVQTIVAAWKVAAVPVPVRWDLPDWERQRILAVIDAAVELDASSRDWLATTASLDPSPLPAVVSQQTHGICSSGSSGTPKVILVNRPGIYDPEIYQPFPSGWGEVARPQVICVPAPIYHTNGFATLFSLAGGDRLVLLERFGAARVVDLIERHRVTTFTAAPTMLQRIAALPGLDDRDLSSLVWVLQGAAAIAPSLVRRWIELVGAERFYMAYGMTEGLGLTAIRGDEWLEHPGSVGRGYRSTEIRVLGPDGTDLPPGEIGEIFLRSPTGGLCTYVGDAVEPIASRDGFSTVHDLGWLTDDGFLHLADRRVDLIISGGANVYPAEVETALSEHPGIADVVVIGLADAEWGHRVHAIVEPSDRISPPSATDVIAFAKERLASYKAPKTVEFVHAIPRSEATKVNRVALVEERGG